MKWYPYWTIESADGEPGDGVYVVDDDGFPNLYRTEDEARENCGPDERPFKVGVRLYPPLGSWKP